MTTDTEPSWLAGQLPDWPIVQRLDGLTDWLTSVNLDGLPAPNAIEAFGGSSRVAWRVDDDATADRIAARVAPGETWHDHRYDEDEGPASRIMARYRGPFSVTISVRRPKGDDQ